MKYTFFLFLLMLNYLQARTYYVEQSNPNAVDDINHGSVELPYRTISYATQKLIAGDICYVKKGIYREKVTFRNSGTINSKIYLLRYGLDEVVLSGLDTLDRNAIQTTQTGLHSITIPSSFMQYIHKYSQLFMNCQELPLSKFPDITDFFNLNQFAKITNDPILHDEINNDNDWVSFTCNSLPNSTNINLTGAPFCCLGASPQNIKERYHWTNSVITDHIGDSLTIYSPQLYYYGHVPYKDTPFYIMGGKKTINAEGEYSIDNNIITFKASIISGPLEIRTRRYAIDLNGKSNIYVKGFNIVAGTVYLSNNSNCTISNCNIQYPTEFSFPDGQVVPEEKWGVLLSGSNNTIENCYISHSWGNGITLDSIGNIIRNCAITDVGKLGTYCSNIYCKGSNHIIEKNTLRKSGKYGINHQYAINTVIKLNDISYCMLNTEDGGGTYGLKSSNADISYNWVHDIQHVGIYADDAPKDYNIHHNVVFNVKVGIYSHAAHLDWGGARNIRIDSNTVFASSSSLCFEGGYSNNVEYRDNIHYGNIDSGNYICKTPPFSSPINNGDYQIHYDPITLPDELPKYFPNWLMNDFHVSDYRNSSLVGKGAYLNTDTWIPGCTLRKVNEPYIWFPLKNHKNKNFLLLF